MIKFQGLREPVQLQSIQPELIQVLRLLCVYSARSGYDIRIHSMHDHTHSRTSLHYRSLALDCAIHHRNGRPDHGAMRTLTTVLRRELGYGYDIVFDAQGGMWFTDLGKTMAETMHHGAVYYAKADGSAIEPINGGTGTLKTSPQLGHRTSPHPSVTSVS